MKEEKPTSIDIAHLAGVSQPTVSRALRNSPLVSEETRAKVQAIARQLNYKVDVNASNLRSRQSRTIALLFCEDPGTGESLINPFFLSMLGSITRASATRGYDLLISFQQFSDDWSADYENTRRADGVICLGYGDYLSYVEKISQLDKVGAHFITWGPVVDGQPGNFIGCDNRHSAYVATEHLIDLGRKKIAFIGGASEHCPEFKQRYEGYAQALKAAKLRLDPELQFDSHTSEDEGYQAAMRLQNGKLEFDAIFAASDLIAIGAIKALRENGLHVPKDVAVVGFDDILTASYINPPLTTVRQDTALAGEVLVENLIRLIDGEAIESMLMPTRLIVRESCGAKL